MVGKKSSNHIVIVSKKEDTREYREKKRMEILSQKPHAIILFIFITQKNYEKTLENYKRTHKNAKIINE